MSDGHKLNAKRPWGVWSGIAVVFICGLLVGIAGTTVYQHYQQPSKTDQGLAGIKTRVMKHLTHELALSDEQQHAVERLVTEAERELLDLRMAQQPRVENTLNNTVEKLKTTLTPDQQGRLDDIYSKLLLRWESDRQYIRKLHVP